MDIYYSAAATPGDPEDGGAANWTLLAENATFTAAPGSTDYTGFDLATEVGISWPNSGVRYIRFEVDSHHGGNALSRLSGYLRLPSTR